jgi:hypothetical protein
MAVTQSDGPPDPCQCQGEADVGRLHHDLTAGVWYECMFDARRETFTWAALPLVD